MKRFHARVAVVKALQDAGLFVEAKDNPMQIPVCSKSGDVIEPLLKPQWWVNCKPLAEEAIKVGDSCPTSRGRCADDISSALAQASY